MMDRLDTSFLHALPLAVRPWEELRLILVGVGGTGSWLAPHVARLVSVLKEQSKRVSFLIVDPDIVEAKNMARQNFCHADVHREPPLYKATSMAFRLGMMYGIDIDAVTERFDPDLLEDYPYPDYREHIERLTVILGCTDNAAARRSIFNVLEANRSYEAPRFWVLDCGNVAESGQVLLGSAHTVEAMRHAFKFARQCIALPSPALQAPDLLVPRPEEQENLSLSCAEMAVANTQSLMMNCALAYEAADYLLRMLITGTLKRYATYIDLPSGRKTSSYITPESLARTIGKDASFFLKK
jgi:PRTRC genetic system ThiF family protein